MKKYVSILIVFAFIGIFVFLNLQKGKSENISNESAEIKNITFLKIGNTVVQAEVVTTPEAQAQGLGGKEGLREDEGMLFVFETPGVYAFWMKDVKFAIDIIWFNSNKEIIYIKKDALPGSFPESFGPETDSLYVLEVPSGFADHHNLQIGDKAEFDF